MRYPGRKPGEFHFFSKGNLLKGVAADEVFIPENEDVKVVFAADGPRLRRPLADLVRLIRMYLDVQKMRNLHVDPFVPDSPVAFIGIFGQVKPRPAGKRILLQVD